MDTPFLTRGACLFAVLFLAGCDSDPATRPVSVAKNTATPTEPPPHAERAGFKGDSSHKESPGADSGVGRGNETGAVAQRSEGPEPETNVRIEDEGPPALPAPHKEPYPADNPNIERTTFGPSLWLETEKVKGQVKRRVIVNSAVCLRDGQYGLECLLCRRNTKEHEAILSTEANAEKIHALLIVCGGKPGSPVKFEPKYAPPSGSKVKISLVYKEKDKLVRVPAQEWVQDRKTKKDLNYDWVFAGSLLWRDDFDEKNPVMRYAANGDGAYICVTNVPTAMIDLPINSSNALEDRTYVPITGRIPELGTKVDVFFEVVAEEKKK